MLAKLRDTIYHLDVILPPDSPHEAYDDAASSKAISACGEIEQEILGIPHQPGQEAREISRLCTLMLKS